MYNKTLKSRRIIGIVIVLAMSLLFIPVSADVNPTISFTPSNGTVKVGNEIDVTVTIDKQLPVAMIQFTINFDPQKLNVLSDDKIKNHVDFPNVQVGFNNTLGTATIVELTGEDQKLITPPYVIATFTLTAIEAGSSNISISKTKYSYIVDGVIQHYDVSTNNSTITINSGTTSHGGSSTPTPTPSPTPTPTPTVAPTPTPPAVVNVEVKPVVADGKATSTVTEAAANKAITEAIATAKKDNTTSEVNINVEKSTEVVTTVETSIKESTMTALKSKSVDNVTVSTQLVDVSFDKKAITVISDNTKNDVSLSVEKVDNTTLSAEIQKEVGAKPVYDFNLISNGKKISDFKDGSAKISIPYILKDGEKAQDLVIYYIKDDGTLQKMTNVKYDEKLKAAVFYTNHFSKFAIAFEIQFTDVSGWSEEFIYYLAKKGIINGKEDGIFAPEDNITRAEFVAIIARSVGVGKDQIAKAEYSDVTVADWFAPYVTWAKEKGIVSGYEDGSFAPNKEITREELCTMIVRTLTAYNLAPEKAELSFADANTTSDWAKESIASLAKLGIVSGKGDNQFAPLDNATRAESAKIITGMYKILNNIK